MLERKIKKVTEGLRCTRKKGMTDDEVTKEPTKDEKKGFKITTSRLFLTCGYVRLHVIFSPIKLLVLMDLHKIFIIYIF